MHTFRWKDRWGWVYGIMYKQWKMNNTYSQSQDCLWLCASAVVSHCERLGEDVYVVMALYPGWLRSLGNESSSETVGRITLVCSLCSADAARSITPTDLIWSIWCAEMIVHYSCCLCFSIQTYNIDWLGNVHMMQHWPKGLGVFKCIRIVCFGVLLQ